jgi:hypothetical protein
MSTTPKLDALIEHGKQSISPIYVDALVEIREHLQRMPAQASDYDEPSKEAEEFMLAQGRKDMGYPSEAETRLIELVEELLKAYALEWPQYAPSYAKRLAAIKRDLGLPPSP